MSRITCWSLFALVSCSIEQREPPDPPPPAAPATLGVPISGGTLLVTSGGRYAVAADPYRDRVVTVDLIESAFVAEVTLSPGDEPGRVVEDGAGRIHVALRRGGAIVTFDPRAGGIAERRPVCPEPRGIAWSAVGDSIHVVCVDGSLVSLPAGGGAPTRRIVLDRDLRDVVAAGDQLHVSTFRTAELITLDAQGIVQSRVRPPTIQRTGVDENGVEQQVEAHPSVAWRTIGLPDGRVVMSHQRHQNVVLRTDETSGYGGQCDAVEDAITVFAPGQPPFAVAPFPFGKLAVDIAVASTTETVALALAGSHEASAIRLPLSEPDDGECDGGATTLEHLAPSLHGAPTSVAFGPDGTFVAFYPDGPMLRVEVSGVESTIDVPGQPSRHAGRDLFYTATEVGVACASCHPEGREDGRVWEFDAFGLRRTQSVAGGILDRAPYHWIGDQADLSALLDEVFVTRMAGQPPMYLERLAFGVWLDQLSPPSPIVRDPAAIARGQELFESPSVGCIQCHNGPLFTNNMLVDVGTGGRFKVPSLRGVASRAPYLHTGCAPTLLDRFTDPCGGGDQHGTTSQLAPEQLADLVAYLESL